ncbi:MAG: AAA family ATPase [Bryobacterales bacterium]|nr:AAA family ATPase [Bryobacterales bacterium]
MKQLFQWVPWFEALAKQVGQVRHSGLVERVKRVDWAGLRCAVLDQGDERADPLTFFYHLAAIAGGKPEKRRTVYASISKVFGIESDLDHSFSDGFIFPTPPGVTVMFNNTGADPQLLWNMFDRARAFDGTSDDSAIANTFDSTLQIRGVGVAKLTQVLFLINPKEFLPFDRAAVLPLGIGGSDAPRAKISWAEYYRETDKIRSAFPSCECYDVNIIGYLWTKGTLPREGNRWYQISATEESWLDFLDNNWVYHAGQGDNRSATEGDVPLILKLASPLDKPKAGDVILVHSGKREGRGIGIVYRNDYSELLQQNGRIHVVWVNKKRAILAANMPTVRFSRAGRGSYAAFAKSVAYSATMDLLPQPDGPTPSAVHELNQILYGPPGTGKTYGTTTRAMAIVKGIEVDEVTEEHRAELRRLRFDPESKTGQIAMVTFHQSYSYEDFVEGIRPRLAKEGDIGYELRPGIFKRIVDAALNDPDLPYVLIIDEINRGNIPKILGELITLIEPSRRLGEEEATKVTLPYSGDSFGVPRNLHIIGTMNTADRSILPLDTALRRRFDHVEMMPDPDHQLIANDIAGVDLRKMLKVINDRISLLLDRERQIGHTYLFRVNDIESLAATFRKSIVPLLAEYFYDDWSKIRLVLGGSAFVVEKREGEQELSLVDEGLLDPDTTIHEVLPATATEWRDPVQYQLIYDESASVGRNQPTEESRDLGADQS